MENSDFETELEKCRKKLYSYALWLTNDVYLAEDLVQETMIKAYLNKESFVCGNFMAWLRKIMRNHFVNDYRKAHRIEFIDYSDVKAEFFCTECYVEDEYDLEYINKALASHDENYGYMLGFYYMGYSYKEISEMFSLNIGTVKSRMHTLREELKIDLDEFRD